MQGVIVRAISGFYYVRISEGIVYECKARGVFRKKGVIPLVGDRVKFEADNSSATVTEILPRINSFDRPPLSNVETMVIVSSFKSPDPSFVITDRFTVAAEDAGTDIVLCVNKRDLAEASDIKAFEDAYKGVYPLCFVSAVTGEGIDELKTAIKGRQAALAGPSGVGKSTITNLLLGGQHSETGEISKKSLRGKNTTRHTELFSGDGFTLFDTPGFTSFDAVISDDARLDSLFPEFRPFIGCCRFDDCRHIKEPDCEVRKALSEGLISSSRYNSYSELYKSYKESRRF